MPSKRKKSEPETEKILSPTIELYHRNGVNIVGIGICGPAQPVQVDRELAEAWLRDNPGVWSRTPFEIEVQDNAE